MPELKMRKIKIGERWIGEGEPAYLVAEMSANHHQSLEQAIEIIKAAKQAGADAIKIQTYTPDTLTIDCNQEWFRIADDSPWAGKTLYQLYAEACTPWDWHLRLQQTAHELGLEFFSTPFDVTAVDFLENLNVPVYKVASFEIVDLALLRRIGASGKPVILSTGMATLKEIEEGINALRANGVQQIALLKCTSAYPASPREMNLRTMNHLASTFDVVVGLSDHTLGSAVAIAAVSLGAGIVEKHFTMTRKESGPDSSFSMEPAEYADMVRNIRQVEQALGRVSYERSEVEARNMCFRRSLFVVQDVKQGGRFTEVNVRAIRPGYGLAPRYLDDVLGKRASCDIARGTPLSWDLIGGKAAL